MKKFFLVWLCSVMVIGIYGQSITILDEETGSPVEQVILISNEPKAFATTNNDGKADISAFGASGSIQFHKLGYKSQSLSFAQLDSMNFELSLTPGSISMDEVVVSATRWKQVSDDVPSKIISISSRDIDFQNPQTAADLLGLSGKVFIQKSQQGGGSPMIRGFATNRLIYTVDGVRMNTAIFRGGNIQNVINLDPFATESAEVLFGPGSVIYGSDAIGGVMSFSTLTPQFGIDDDMLVQGNAAARYTSANNERTGHFDINFGWDKMAFVSSFSLWTYEDLLQGKNGPRDYLKPYYVERVDEVDQITEQGNPLIQRPSGYNQFNTMQKLRFRPNNYWDIQYAFHYSQTTEYGRYDRHNRTSNGLPQYAEWNYGPQKWMMNNLTLKYSHANQFFDEAGLQVAYQAFEESRISRNLNEPIRETRTENVDAYSANLDFLKSTGSRNTVFYGAELVINDVISTGKNSNIDNNTATSGATRYPDATWLSAGIYVNDEFKLNNKLTLAAGVRYNQFSIDADFSDNAIFYPLPFEQVSLNNGAVSGSMGAVYRPGENWVINTNFGTAFRSPNVDDIGKVFDSEPGAVVVPNKDLDAEYAYNFDLGVAHVFGESVKLDVTGYYTLLENALVRRDDLLNGFDSIIYDGTLSKVQSIQNAAVAHVWGIQTGLEIQFPLGFNFSTDVNYQEGTEELDDGSTSPSRHAAPFFGVSRLNYQKDQVRLQLYTNYQGQRSHLELAVDEREKDEIYARDKDGNNYAPGWYTLNLKGSYHFTGGLTVTAGVENITDQRYRPYSSGISGAGRNLLLNINFNF